MARDSKRITLHDVARHAAVSVATASYTLNGSDANRSRIGAPTRERVLAAARELGYVPHQSAQSLRRRATNRICLSVPRLGVPRYDALARELQREGERRGLHLIVTVGRDSAGAGDAVQHLQGGLADAVVLVVERRLDGAVEEQLAALASRGLAIVVLGNHIAPKGFDVIGEGDDEACFDAVRWLIEQGHRRIGCLALELEPGQRHERYDSYRRALESAGIDLDDALVRDGAGNRHEALAAARELLASNDPPTAIFACTDIAAMSAIRAARDAGLRVPEDVAVVGAGDIDEGEFIDPPLTTVGPVQRDFRDVAELVFGRLSAREPLPGRNLVKRWELKIRGSA